MEGTHGQLGTRLADGLRSNHTHSLAVVDQTTTTQIAAVAHGAQTKACFAVQGGADFDFVNAQHFEFVDQVFVEHRASFRQHSACFWMHDVFSRHATQDTFTQRFDHLTTFDDSAHDLSVAGAAIHVGHHQVLGHVDQTTCQVARVRCLQRGIGQTFTRTVCRDEVLQHIQAFAEVRSNRRFNDRAIRLGHQTAHTSQLANLSGRTTCT